MFPSNFYSRTQLITNLLLPVASRTPPVGRIASYVITMVVGLGALSFVPTTLSLACLTVIPIHEIYKKYPNLATKILWLSPVINIGAITAVAYALFNFTTNPYAKTVVFTIHQLTIGILGRAHSVSWFGMVTLDNGFSKLLGVNEELISSRNVDSKRIEKISELLACTAFIVSTIGLANLGFHPILNSAISSIMASAIKALSIRVLLALAPINEEILQDRN